jgi:anti-sigma regulatory factor (Ser/Thr protein kinase)
MTYLFSSSTVKGISLPNATISKLQPISPKEAPIVCEAAKSSITLCILSRLDQVRLVRAALFGILSHLQICESDIQSLQLAVSELVNNCFEHGYKGAQDRTIEIKVEVCNSDVVISLIDDAPLFPEDQRFRLLGPPVPFDESDEKWTPRGHGLQIVKQIVDSITLTEHAGGNCITLRKHVDHSYE